MSKSFDEMSIDDFQSMVEDQARLQFSVGDLVAFKGRIYTIKSISYDGLLFPRALYYLIDGSGRAGLGFGSELGHVAEPSDLLKELL